MTTAATTSGAVNVPHIEGGGGGGGPAPGVTLDADATRIAIHVADVNIKRAQIRKWLKDEAAAGRFRTAHEAPHWVGYKTAVLNLRNFLVTVPQPGWPLETVGPTENMPTPERYVTPHPLPSPYVNELLTILIEECAEVIQRATKAQRFGLAECQPGQEKTNSRRLAEEIGDIQCVAERLIRAGAIGGHHIQNGMLHKAEQLDRYMQQREVSDGK